MKNQDLINQKKRELLEKLNQALKDGNEKEFGEAFSGYIEMLEEAVMAEAKGLVQASDNQVLAGRGARALTSKEKNYYEQLIGAMKSRDPRQALASLEVTLPETVIDSVFEDIVEEHPLLKAINFQNTGALTEIIVSVLDGRQLAAWGKLTDKVVKELSAGFEAINLTANKLTAFIPVSKPMLDLGPKWIDRYVRAHLTEAIYNGLEDGIINGKGLNEPTGMRRNPKSALDPEEGYDLQPITPLKEITPKTYGEIISQLAVSSNGLTRAISEVLLIVNPSDYFAKIIPATSYQKQGDGTYVQEIFPFPTQVVQSAFVPKGEALIGLPKRYFMGIGTGKGGKIDYSDDYRFLEDERLYMIKLYGTGKPLDEKSFIRLDVEDLEPTPLNVNVVGMPEENEIPEG